MAGAERSKGTTFESGIVTYGEHCGLQLSRMPLHGTRDQGDISGYEIRGHALACEAKNWRNPNASTFANQLKAEVANLRAKYGIVVFKRPGAGAKRFGDNYVLTTLEYWNEMVLDANPEALAVEAQDGRTYCSLCDRCLDGLVVGDSYCPGCGSQIVGRERHGR